MSGGFEDLLSTPALEALISVNGDEKQLNPEIQKEILNAKLAVFDAQQASLDEQIKVAEAKIPVGYDAVSKLNDVADFVAQGVGSAAGSLVGAPVGGFLGGAVSGGTLAPAGAFLGAGVGGQEGADVGQSILDTVRNAGDRFFNKEAPQGGVLGDFLSAQTNNRDTNVLGDPRDVGLGSLLEVGLGGLGAKYAPNAKYVDEATNLANQVGDVLPEIKDAATKAAIINESGQQMAAGNYAPIATAFNAKGSATDLMDNLSSGQGTIGDKVAELSSTFFKDTDNFTQVKQKAANTFTELAKARSQLIKDVPVETVANNLVNENPDLFINIADQVALAAKKGSPEAKELLPAISKMIEGQKVSAEELLTLSQKLKGVGYKTASGDTRGFNIELFKSAGNSINNAIKGVLSQSENADTLLPVWDDLTDSMNALKWIEGATDSATLGANALAKKANTAANTAAQKTSWKDWFSNFYNSTLKYGLAPKPAQESLIPESMGLAQQFPRRSLDLLEQQAGAMTSPIAIPETPSLLGRGMQQIESRLASPASFAAPMADEAIAGIGNQYRDTAMSVPSLSDLARASNFGISDANAANNIDAALNMGIPQTPDQMSLDGGLLAPQEFGDPLLEGINTEDFYADKINIPDALGEVVGQEQEAKQTPTLERTAASVMDYVSKVDPDMSGIPKDSLDAVKALLSGSVEDQRAGVYELIKAAPSLFGGSKIPGIDSLVDGVIIDPDERVKATQKLAKVLDGDPVRKIEVINKIRREEPLPSWAYKYMGGEEQKSFEDTFLEQQEGFKPKAYLDTRGNPTIGMGVNLGAFDVKSLRDTGVSENVISKVLPLLGTKGELAKQRIKDYPVSLDEDEALELSKAIKQASKDTLESQYKTETGASLEDLPVQARTVMLSLAYNFGDIKKKLPTFWDYATMGRWDEASNFLEKQTWKQPELTARRQKEAALLKEIAPDTIQLAANVGYDDDATNGMKSLDDGEKIQTYKF